jgi:hypothetical protein
MGGDDMAGGKQVRGWRRLAVLVAVTAAAVTVAGVALTSIPASSGVIHVPSASSSYRTVLAAKGSQGEQGLPRRQGYGNYKVSTASGVVRRGKTRSIEAVCPSNPVTGNQDGVATGGGFRSSVPNPAYDGLVGRSSPNLNDNGWMVTMTDGNTYRIFLKVYVICTYPLS